MADNEQIRKIFERMVEYFPRHSELMDDTHESLRQLRGLLQAIEEGREVPIAEAKRLREAIDFQMPFIHNAHSWFDNLWKSAEKLIPYL